MKRFNKHGDIDWAITILAIIWVFVLIGLALSITSYVPPRYDCPRCGAEWNEDTALKVHTFAHNTYYCPDCNANGTLVIIGSD